MGNEEIRRIYVNHNNIINCTLLFEKCNLINLPIYNSLYVSGKFGTILLFIKIVTRKHFNLLEGMITWNIKIIIRKQKKQEVIYLAMFNIEQS